MKKVIVVSAVVVGLFLVLLGGGLWYFLSDDPEDTDSGGNLARTLIVSAIKGATLGTWYLNKAADMPAETLLAELVAMKGKQAGDEAVKPVSDVELEAIASRAGQPLPAELTAILRTPGAIGALQWARPADIATLREMYGDKVASKFRMEDRYWQGGSVKVESYGGAVHRVPTAALEHYIVLAEDRLLSDVMLLYDPAEPPAHPCCRVIETSAFKSQNHDAYRSLVDYLRWEWAMAKAK